MRKNSMKKLVIGCSLAMACSLVGGIALTNSLVQADAADLTTNEDFKMVAGAAIRYDEQKHGLRFAAEIGGEEDLVDNANYYMLIVPERYLTNLNVSVADTTNYYVELKTKLEAISEDAAASLINLACKPFEATETTENFTAGNYYVYGTVSNVLFNNSNENFFGISYYTTGEGETLTYTYANVANAGDNVRNITYIASRAYETNDYEGDTQKKAILEGYIYNGINKHLGQAQGTALDINQLTLDQSTLTLGKGTSSKITVSVLPSTIPMTFRSGNESIAKVAADGTVTAVGVGSTNITVSMLGVERTCAVTVEEVYANYQTKIYAQDGTGEYVLISSNEDEGIVGETVAIENYATIPTVDLPLTQEYSGGYVFNADKSNVSGEVAGDGSLVLKAYYDTAFRYKNIPSSNDNIVKNGNTYTMNNGFLYQSGPMYQMFGTYSDCAVITVEITAPVATILGERGASGLDRTVGILAATNDMVPAGTAWSGETAPAGYLRSVGFYPHTKGAGISWNGLPFCYAADHPNSDLQHPLNKPVDGVVQSGWQPFAYASNGAGGYTVTDDTVELTIVLYNNRFYIFIDDAFCTSKGFNDYAVADSAGDTNQIFEDGDKFVFGVFMTQTVGYDYTFKVTEEAYDANATALLNSVELYATNVLGLTNTALVSTMSVVSTMPAVPVSRKEYL